MPSLKRVPGVPATKPKRGRSRRRSHGRAGRWWRTVKVVILLQRIRHRARQQSSPSGRQILLVIVSAGIAIVLIRGFARRSASKTQEQYAAGTQSPGAVTPPGPTSPGPDSTLTEAVRSEMRGHDAPSTTTEAQ